MFLWHRIFIFFLIWIHLWIALFCFPFPILTLSQDNILIQSRACELNLILAFWLLPRSSQIRNEPSLLLFVSINYDWSWKFCPTSLVISLFHVHPSIIDFSWNSTSKLLFGISLTMQWKWLFFVILYFSVGIRRPLLDITSSFTKTFVPGSTLVVIFVVFQSIWS